jgi:hypothetical protein
VLTGSVRWIAKMRAIATTVFCPPDNCCIMYLHASVRAVACSVASSRTNERRQWPIAPRTVCRTAVPPTPQLTGTTSVSITQSTRQADLRKIRAHDSELALPENETLIATPV